MDIAAQKVAEAKRWASMHIKADRIHEFDAVARKLVGAKARYQTVEAHLVSVGMGVPWWVIAVIHEREAGGNFSCQLAQGDPLDRPSVNEPAGRGPFLGAGAFERGCYDALIDCAPHAGHWTDWTPGGVATILEEYNGEGYAAMGRPSPYDWGGTDQYVSGKYIADGVFSASAVDTQPGTMPLIARMMAIDPSIKFAEAPGKWTAGAPAAQPPKPQPIPAPSIVPPQKPAPDRPGTLRDFLDWLRS